MRQPEPQNLRILIDEQNVINETSLSQMPGVVLLDEASVTTRLGKLSEADPYFARRNVSKFVEKVSRRLANRMARSFSSEWAAPKEVIAEAIYFQLWVQLCTIIPLRRLARSIAREAKQSTVLVVLPKLDVSCFELWGLNELEPLILCWALQRQGCNAYLLCKVKLIAPVVELNLHPSPRALPQRGPEFNDKLMPKGRLIIAQEGMRGLHLVGEEVKNAVSIAGAILMSAPVPGSTFFLLGPTNPQTTISIKFREQNRSDVASLRQFFSPWPNDPLSFYFNGILGPYFGFMLKRMRSFLAEAKIADAHVCDHLFLASSILAHAIKERDGRVTLWPHSANPVNADLRGGKYFDEIVVLTRAAREIWQRRFPDKPVRLRPRIMLPPQRAARGFDPSAPMTVVVFGGAHFLARLPLFRVESHIRTYQRFFALRTSSFVRFIFKPRDPIYESAAWLRGILTGPLNSIGIDTRQLTELDYPNMIFVTIGYGSTALLEGIACAVPCLMVREQDIEDFTTLSEEVVPIGDTEFIWETIKRCRNQEHYNKLLQTQIDYLAHQTAPDPEN